MSGAPRRALVREVADSLAGGLSAVPPPEPVDVARARAQHAAYVRALAGGLGLEVERVAADEAAPDCVFIEDTAVVAGGVALVTRPGAEARRREPGPVAEALGKHLELHHLQGPGTLDGGDCLRLGRRLYVGLTARTNAAGIDEAGRMLGRHGVEVIGVPLSGALHLKSVCSPLDDETVLVAEGFLPAGSFGAARELVVPRAETPGANAVFAGGVALMAEGFPRAREAVDKAGFRTVAVDTSEFRKLDGALTCMSILF